MPPTATQKAQERVRDEIAAQAAGLTLSEYLQQREKEREAQALAEARAAETASVMMQQSEVDVELERHWEQLRNLPRDLCGRLQVANFHDLAPHQRTQLNRTLSYMLRRFIDETIIRMG
ncbi:MAG: hypothetical protein ACLQU2_01235 [Candidatus Binataceae bacterium]